MRAKLTRGAASIWRPRAADAPSAVLSWEERLAATAAGVSGSRCCCVELEVVLDVARVIVATISTDAGRTATSTWDELTPASAASECAMAARVASS